MVVAYPDSAGQSLGVSEEARVDEVLGGAGLPGSRLAESELSRLGRRAPRHDLGEHCSGGLCSYGINDGNASMGGAEEGSPIGIGDLLDEVWMKA